jgi:hypothetical protein
MGRCLLLDPVCQAFFVLGSFYIGSRELFTWAGFEPCNGPRFSLLLKSHWYLA